MQSQMPIGMNPLVSLSLQWLESWRCTAELNRRSLEEMRRMRNRMFQDVSSCMESYMKSPAFLGLMRYNMMMMSQAMRQIGTDGHPASMGYMGRPMGAVESGAPAGSLAMVDSSTSGTST